MILQYAHLNDHPSVFRSMTGVSMAEFDTLMRTCKGIPYGPSGNV